MNKFFTIAMLIFGFAAYSLAAFAEEAKPANKISDDEFLQKMSEGIKAYAVEQPEVARLGWGTCRILLSGKPTKNKFTGSGEGVEVVPPVRKSLFRVISAETKRPQPEKSVPTVWIAWRDHLGQLNLAFNSRLEEYECSTVWEVDDLARRKWRAWDTHTLEELNGFQREKKPWVTRETPEFGWIIVGFCEKAERPEALLKALSTMRIICEEKFADNSEKK